MKMIGMIQARMGSTRFPGKVLEKLNGLTVLGRVLDKARQLDIDDLMVLTTIHPEDRAIVDFCAQYGVKCMQAGRALECFVWYLEHAIRNQADYFVRICGDSPFIDVGLANAQIKIARENGIYPYVSYQTNQRVPAVLSLMGIFVEVVKTATFALCFDKSIQDKIFEHVTPHLYKYGHYLDLPSELEQYGFKLSIDTPEDLQYATRFINAEPRGEPMDWQDIFLKLHTNKFLRREPENQPYTQEVLK